MIVALVILITVYKQLYVQAEIIKNGQLVLTKVFKQHSDEVWDVEFSPDNILLGSCGLDKRLKIYSLNEAKVLHDIEHPEGIPTLSFNPKGKTICTGSYDGKVRVWDLKTGSLLNTLIGNNGTLWSVSYSPSGNIIAGAGTAKKIFIWNAINGQLIKTLDGHDRDIWSLSFSPDGTTLASSGSDRSIRIYDVNSGKMIKTIKEHTDAVISVAYSPDGNLLASGGDDKVVNIWDTKSWKLIRTLKKENQSIYSVAFSSDNKTILSAGRDKKVLGEFLQYRFNYRGPLKDVSARLWDVNSGELLHTITEHENDIWSVCFSNDGNWLASSSVDKTVKIWQLK